MKVLCQQDGSGICSQCNRPIKHGVRRTCDAWKKLHGKDVPPPRRGNDKGLSHRKGLGSSLARIFKFFGFKQKPGCGCARREIYLNEVGQRIHFSCIGLWNRLFPFWAKPLPNVRRKRSLNPNKLPTSEQVAAKVAAIKMRESLAKVKNL